MVTIVDRRPEFRSDGRRKGDHGARSSEAIRRSVLQTLEAAEVGGQLAGKVLVSEAQRAGVDKRTVQRWRRDAMRQRATRVEADSEADGTPLAPWLLRYKRQGRALELTQEELEYLASFRTVALAIEDLRSSDSDRLSAYSRSSIYRAWSNVAHQTRVGLRKGAKAQRAVEMTFPLPYLRRINEVHTIDEYDLKVRAVLGDGNVVEPKLLIVRENASGLILASAVLTQAATSADARRVLGAAIVGWLRDDVEVYGPARMVRCDQGATFLSAEVHDALLQVGTGLDPSESYAPQGNGAHERIHQTLPDFIGWGAGSRRGHITRSGERIDHGLIPLVDVERQVAEWTLSFNDHVYSATAGDKAGRSPWEIYREFLAEGALYRLDIDDEQLAQVAVVTAERTLDVTRGVRLGNQWFIGPSLADVSRRGMRITLAQLLDPGVVYAFDRYGHFLDVLTVAGELPDEMKADMLAARAGRAATTTALVKARASAASAQADLLQAQAGHPNGGRQDVPDRAQMPVRARPNANRASELDVDYDDVADSFPVPRRGGDDSAS